MTSRIAIRGLHKAFAANRVLSGVDLDIAAGESMVVIGGSGTGKSVLLKCITGLMEPDSGTVAVDGETVSGGGPARRAAAMRRMGLLFQHGALFDSLSVLDNVAFGLINAAGRPRAEAYRAALDKLAQVGLGGDSAHMSAGTLSGGMRKRVALARAIATEPDILLFDEPTTGLDPIMGDVIDRLIAECVRRLGATALTITHDMDSARRIGDRIAMLHGGRMIWCGPAADVGRSGDGRVDQFVHGRPAGPLTANDQPPV